MKRAVLLFLLMPACPHVANAIDQGYTNFKSSVTFNGAPILKASSPTTLSTTTNNYNWGTKPVVRSSATLALNLTGFAGGRDGILFTLINVSTNTITIVNGSTFSSSGNRITTDTGSNVSLGTGDSRSFWYDAISLVWRILR